MNYKETYMGYNQVEYDYIHRETQKAVMFVDDEYFCWVPKSCLTGNYRDGYFNVEEDFDIDWKKDGVPSVPSTKSDRVIKVNVDNRDELWEYI